MADWVGKLKSLQKEQKELLQHLDSAVQDAEKDNILTELSSLRKEIEEKETLLKELKKKFQKTEEENQDLRTSLREQILDEKLNIIKISKEKLETYFLSENDKNHQGLMECFHLLNPLT